MRLSLLVVVLASVLVAAYAPDASPASPTSRAARPDSVWTWPERSENLEVLPDTTSAETLRAVMQSFTRALGVRCSECHVGQGRDFRTWDFASDAKPHKEVARGMMRMTMEINADELPDALESHDHGDNATPAAGGEVHVHGDGTRHVHEVAAEAAAERAPDHTAMRVSCWTCHRGQSRPETSPPAETENP
ncbi:MAG TPA: c-type cytochrome [Rubricoccaceae bacterium]|jgi:hypothetical protein